MLKRQGYLIVILLLILVGCNKNDNQINVITREAGSGTRTVFVEITGVYEETEDTKKDTTSVEAIVQNNTEAVMTAVAGDKNAIGYISLGSLREDVKALKIEGVEPTSENIQNNSYKLQRPFNIVYDEGSSDVLDFINFIESDEGQKIVESAGYVANYNNTSYTAIDNRSSITIAGSTSISSLMEKLYEAYKKYNPQFNANIQATGSSAGIQAIQEHTAEIGMVSRELKESEKDLNYKTIARDGIAVIVNPSLNIDDISIMDLKDIFTGEITTWE